MRAVKGFWARGALATAVGVFATTAWADTASTNAGLRIQSADGNFEGRLGARLQFDGYFFSQPERDNSEIEREPAQANGTEFRRTRITLRGRAYGWDYILENDFSDSSPNAGYRDVNISRIRENGILTIGQFKPFRSMEEWTSSNEITMMERAFSSSTALYAGRQFQQGVGYRHLWERATLGVSAYSLRAQGTPRNDGVGLASRATFAPIRSNESTLHLGISYNVESRHGVNPQTAVAQPPISGRRGATLANAFGGAVPSLASSQGDTFDALGLELGYTRGPWYVQSELVEATFGQPSGADETVRAFYLMGSFNLSGLTKPYNRINGSFQSVSARSAPSLELTARIDGIENRDSAARPEVTNITLGANLYLNPNMRFMVNGVFGEAKAIVNGQEQRFDQNQLAVRAQYAF